MDNRSIKNAVNQAIKNSFMIHILQIINNVEFEKEDSEILIEQTREHFRKKYSEEDVSEIKYVKNLKLKIFYFFIMKFLTIKIFFNNLKNIIDLFIIKYNRILSFIFHFFIALWILLLLCYIKEVSSRINYN